MSDNKTSVLQERELYLLPTRVSEWSLLYAPLADALMLVSDDDVRQLADAIECPDRATAETMEIIDGLCNVTPVCESENNLINSNDFKSRKRSSTGDRVEKLPSTVRSRIESKG